MKLISIFFFALLTSMYAQGFEFGLHYQTSVFVLSDPGVYSSPHLRATAPTIWLGSIKYNINPGNGIYLRAGYAATSLRMLDGPEIGFYYHKGLRGNLSAVTGIKAHIVLPEKYPSHTVTFAGIGLDYKMGKITSFEVIYNKSLNEIYFSGGQLPTMTLFVYHEIQLAFVIYLK